METNIAIQKLLDPKFYLENFCRIKGKKPGQLIPFILNEAQKDLYNTIKKNSRIIILKARQLGFCLHEDTKVLMADLTWKKIKDIVIDDEVIAIDENIPAPKKQRKMKTARVEKTFAFETETLELTFSDGRVIIATPEHRLLSKKWECSTDTVWKKVSDMEIGTSVRAITNVWGESDYEDGWFSGMIDGEGSVSKSSRTGFQMTISQVKGAVWSRLISYVNKNKISYRIEIDRRKAGDGSKLGSKEVYKVVINKMDELFSLLGKTTPSRIRKGWWEGKALPNNGWIQVVNIKKIGKTKVVDLQTSCSTYIAEGIVSHNSTAVTGYFYHNTITVPGTTTALIGYNSDLTSELLDKVKTLYKSTPEDLRPTIHYNSKFEISFPSIDSKILVLPSTENVGRGYTLSNVLATEVASWRDAEEKMMALEASVPIDGKLIIESCVTGDTIVFTNNGLVKVKDVHNWNDYPLGFSKGKEIKLDGHYGLKPTNIYYNSGIKKGIRIKTKHGYGIGMSSVHKLFVLRGDKLEFIESKDLNVGDKLTIKYGQELWGNNDKINFIATPYGFNKKHIKLFCEKKVSPDLAYLMGLIIGDGYVDFTQGRVVITTTDPDVSNFLLKHPFGLKFLQSKGNDKYHYICKNESFVEFLSKYMGMLQRKAPHKEIPNIVLSWSRNNVIAFLQGLFDSDGSCRKDRGEVSLVSSSKKIVDIVRIMLLNFGIISRTYSHGVKPTKRVSAWSFVHQLEISRSHSNVFLDKIGFRIKRKKNNGKICKECYSCLQEFVPGLGKILKKNMKELGLKYSDVSSGMNKCFFSKSGNVTYFTLGKILEKCRNKQSDEYLRIKELYKMRYFYDEISEIIPIEENVYDFTVNDGHTVTYSGIVGHQTPNGQGNLFHRMWMMDNDYAKKEYGWWWGYTQDQIDIIRRRMRDPRRFAQEYGLEFLASGRSVFDINVIKEQRENTLRVNDPVKEDNSRQVVYEKDDLRIYKEPQKDGIYVIGVDVSEGVADGDYSVATIWNRKTGEEVAMYRGLIPPDLFANKLNRWGREYNNALMVVEINNHGLTTITVLKQLLYPTLYFRPSKFETMDVSASDKMGWKTTKMTRPLLIDDFAQACRDKELIIHSKELLDEMSVFVYNDAGNMVSQSGFNDDTIFSAAIAIQGFKVMCDGVPTQIEYEDHLPKNFIY